MSLLIELVISLVAAIVGAILGAYLQKLWTPNPTAEIASLRQSLVNVQEQLVAFEKDRTTQKHDDELWASKFESAASQVVKVGPSLTIRSPENNSFMPLCGLIFPEIDTKNRIKPSSCSRIRGTVRRKNVFAV
jgi:hypothetical protein